MDLNTLMEIDHVVRVRDDGTVTDQGTIGVYAPEIHIEYDGPFADAQISDAQERDMIEYVRRQGWEIQTGWSAQWNYAGPIMHTSEFIGGRIADHIREHPGYWVACSVELHPGEDDPEYNNGNGESESAGWVLAHRETGL